MASISIIVPVYKVEMYLHQCISDLLNQTIKDIEIIFVNDGSPDNCGEILESYRKKDNRIKVINKINSGVSDTRNYGLKVAAGKYVGFVDPDDKVDPNMYEAMYNMAESNNCDLIICGYTVEFQGGKSFEQKFPFPENSLVTGKELKNEINSYFIESEHCGAVWNKLYRRDIIEKNNIIFSKNVYVGEDYLFNMEYLTYVKSAVYMSKPFYRYYRRDNTAMTKYWNNKFETYSLLHYKTLEYMKKWKMLDRKYIICEAKKYFVWIDVSIREEFKKDNPKNLFESFIRIRFIINDEEARKTIKIINDNNSKLKLVQRVSLKAIKSNNIICIYCLYTFIKLVKALRS